MASSINTAIPPFGNPTTAGVRNNFATAKSEIEALQSANGFADYNAATTPIALSSGVWTKLLNNGSGPLTKTDGLPAGVTSLWNTTTSQFDFTGLPLNSMVDARYDITVTTTAANQSLELSVKLGIGSPSEYQSQRLLQQFKTAGTYNIVAFGSSYIGSNDIKNYPGEVLARSDASASIVVNGWFIRAFKRLA